MAPKHNEVVRKEVEDMLKAGIITPSSSDWPFSVVIATKKHGKPRFCVEYRVLNERMKADRFPLSKIQEIIDELAGGIFFTKLELFFGYWQIKLDKHCKKKTTFVCRSGTFQFEVMPFGLMNAPSTFQRMMNEVVGHLGFVKVYLDDVVIFLRSLSEHIGNISQVVLLIAENGLKVKVSKSEFAKRKVALLGHLVDKNGVQVDPSKLEVI